MAHLILCMRVPKPHPQPILPHPYHVDAGDDVEAAGGVAERVVRDKLVAARHGLVDGVAALPHAQRLAKAWPNCM